MYLNEKWNGFRVAFGIFADVELCNHINIINHGNFIAEKEKVFGGVGFVALLFFGASHAGAKGRRFPNPKLSGKEDAGKGVRIIFMCSPPKLLHGLADCPFLSARIPVRGNTVISRFLGLNGAGRKSD